jgi:hypothetical protein
MKQVGSLCSFLLASWHRKFHRFMGSTGRCSVDSLVTVVKIQYTRFSVVKSSISQHLVAFITWICEKKGGFPKNNIDSRIRFPSHGGWFPILKKGKRAHNKPSEVSHFRLRLIVMYYPFKWIKDMNIQYIPLKYPMNIPWIWNPWNIKIPSKSRWTFPVSQKNP